MCWSVTTLLSLFTDHFNWQPCQISSGPKDQVRMLATPLAPNIKLSPNQHTQRHFITNLFPPPQKLTIHLPYSSEPWLSQAFSYLKKHPYHMPSSSKQGRAKNKDVYVEVTDGSHPADHEIQFSGP